MPIKYFSTAWAEIKSSPSWMAKVLLLGLICFIPVFGPIVLYGYLFGWSRELAWRVDAPLPARIFDNSDGKLYRRGFFALVIVVVFNIIPLAYSCAYSVSSDSGSSMALIGLILSIAMVLIGLAATAFGWVGGMRMALYNKLSAGFQVSKIWKMIRRDTNGIMRILGMYVLTMAIVVAAYTVVFTVICMLVVIPIAVGMGMGSSAFAGFALLGMFMVCGVLSLAALYVLVCLSVFVDMLVANAIGHWVAQFDVALWKGQDDPMPFEVPMM